MRSFQSSSTATICVLEPSRGWPGFPWKRGRFLSPKTLILWVDSDEQRRFWAFSDPFVSRLLTKTPQALVARLGLVHLHRSTPRHYQLLDGWADHPVLPVRCVCRPRAATVRNSGCGPSPHFGLSDFTVTCPN
jgi:hypothetical protein